MIGDFKMLNSSNNCIEIYSDSTVFVRFNYACAVPLTTFFFFFLSLCLLLSFLFGFCVFYLRRLLSWLCHGIIEKKVGINHSVLQSIPVVDFNSHAFKYGVECVFCRAVIIASTSFASTGGFYPTPLGGDEGLAQNHDGGYSVC